MGLAAVSLLILVALWWWFRAADEQSGATEPDETAKSGDEAAGGGGANARFESELEKYGARFAAVDEAGKPILIAVSGRVYDLASREPVAGVDVIFRSRSVETTAASTGDGSYEIELGPGSYTVHAIGDNIYGLQDRRFNLTRDLRQARHDIRVVALARVDGVVVDGRGEPIAGAKVSFESLLQRSRYRSRDLARFLGADSSAESDDSGTFAIDVVPGRVRLFAEADGATGRVDLPEVAPGSRRAARIVIDATVMVSGKVIDAAGYGVAGALVHATSTDPRSGARNTRETRSSDDGRFALDGLVSGEIKLEARAEGHGASDFFARLMKSGDSAEVTLRLADPISISGRVLDRYGKTVSGAQVSAQRSRSKMPLQRTTTDADGAFGLDELGEGPHVVVAKTEGGSKAFAKGIEPPAADLELRLVTPGIIRGSVKTSVGRPVESFTARIVQLTRALDGITAEGYDAPTRFQSADGTFQLPPVDPGTYLVVVGAPGYGASDPVAVAVPDGGYGDGVFTLGSAGTIAGVVRDPAGVPIAGAGVSVINGYEGHDVYTDGAGRFTVTDVTPGRRSITADHADYVTAGVSDVDVRAGETSAIDVELAGADEKSSNQIELVGIGAVVHMSGPNLRIRNIVAGGPAERAKLRAGDLIVAIDGASTEGIALPEAVEQLRGAPGTTVSLEVKRAGKTLSVTVDRARIQTDTPTRGILA